MVGVLKVVMSGQRHIYPCTLGRCDFERKSYDTGATLKAALMSTTDFDGRVL